MNKFPLSAEDKLKLEKQHRRERDSRICDRLKAVLLKDEGWSVQSIAQALRIHEETVRQHVRDWEGEGKLKPENGGSCSKLNAAQTQALIKHLEEKVYVQVMDICAYVGKTFGTFYTVSGMTKWLHQNGFSYKHPKSVPAKADTAKQEAFIEAYLALLDKTPTEETIVFMDSAHPTMATKVTCGWIKKGVDQPIAQTASRTRVNIVGALELKTLKVVSTLPELVNADTIITFFDQLKHAYPDAPKIHIILDQSGYHRSYAVQEAAIANNIVLHYLPPYSPNLNPIERLWKVMNERVRNNVFFASAKEFRAAIADFFEVIFPTMTHSLRSRLNDNFQTLKTASSG